ncbi:MAG: hypothetical protein LUM44_14065 [Pyrinomonadaceae bacterium]|nr:hypothetical protein [Pyrinomonadaceae bacterium]
MELGSGEFRVSKGEQVTIKITPSVGLGKQIVGVLDNSSTLDPFKFTVTKNVGFEHIVKVVYGFIGAASGAQYNVEINGNGAGNKGPFNRVVRNGSSPERVYIFLVV